MEQAKEITRKYQKNDLLMLQQSQTMLNNFIADKQLFVARFTAFADPYTNNWKSDIEKADALPSDDDVVNYIGTLTGDVEAQMQVARNKYQALLVYLRQAFPDDAGVLKLFGQSMYEGARNNQLKLKELMELVAGKANTQPYKKALTDKGFSLADIAMLKTIELNLQQKNEKQEQFISDRPLASQNRIKAHNDVWDRMVAVNDSAQVVFQNDLAKQQQYLLYPEATPTPAVAAEPLTPIAQSQPQKTTVS